ncbi:V(D)J recombination-activating protein 1-like [Patiria miniata]|uniref:RING-type domain-containing protein n=1 Tax=Patiria miniata TaxID=46514 RepID=A0A913ZL54_PATMI|nr:V(D)J recombination-activating protein 1-like [Patiria miniata]
MSFKFHEASLEKICRICTNRLHPGSTVSTRKPVFCANVNKEIFNVFGVSTWEDTPDQHPQKLCEKCARKIRHYTSGERTYSVSNIKRRQTVQSEWPKHSRTGKCFVCKLVPQQGRGGGSYKPKCDSSRQVKSTDSALCFQGKDNIFSELPSQTLSCIVPPSIDILCHRGEEFLFICVICQCIISRPAVQTPCEHVFCSTCLSKCFQFASCHKINCPTCKQTLDFQEVTKIPRILNVQLDNLTVICHNCTQIGRLSQLVDHDCSPNSTPDHKVTIVEAPKSSLLPQDDKAAQITNAARILKELASNHKVGTQIPSEVEEATDKWMCHKLKQDKSLVTIKTGGRVSSKIILIDLNFLSS